MNKHIELVKKWLADKDSVSLEELRDNAHAAYAAYNGAYDAAAFVYYAADVAHAAADAAAHAAADDAAYWVKRYEELTK